MKYKWIRDGTMYINVDTQEIVATIKPVSSNFDNDIWDWGGRRFIGKAFAMKCVELHFGPPKECPACRGVGNIMDVRCLRCEGEGYL